MLKKKKYIFLILPVFIFILWTQIETNQKLVNNADYCIKRMTTNYEPNAFDITRDLLSFKIINWGKEYDEILEKLIERNYFKKVTILSASKPKVEDILQEMNKYNSLKYSYIQNKEIILIGLPEEVKKASQSIKQMIKETT